MTVGLLISRRAYDELPEAYQQALWTACGETFCDRLAAYDAANPPALRRLIDEHGVVVRAYSDDVMEAAWRESHAYLDELAAANAEFRRIYDSYTAFRDTQWQYADGNERAYQQWVIARVERG